MATGPQPTPEESVGPHAEAHPRAADELFSLNHTVASPVKRETDVAGPQSNNSAANPDPTAGGSHERSATGPVTKWDPQSVVTVRDAEVVKASSTVPGSPPNQPSFADPIAEQRTPLVRTRPILRVVRGEIPDLPFVLLEGRNYIGRASPDRPVDIDLTPQEAVERVWASRQHAVVTVDRGTVYVEDMNSLNGTFVNRARIYPGQPRAIQSGDVVQVGTVQLRLEI